MIGPFTTAGQPLLTVADAAALDAVVAASPNSDSSQPSDSGLNASNVSSTRATNTTTQQAAVTSSVPAATCGQKIRDPLLLNASADFSRSVRSRHMFIVGRPGPKLMWFFVLLSRSQQVPL
jgi:hypothetical protein